jgi:hypothetical protein
VDLNLDLHYLEMTSGKGGRSLFSQMSRAPDLFSPGVPLSRSEGGLLILEMDLNFYLHCLEMTSDRRERNFFSQKMYRAPDISLVVPLCM